MSENNKEVVRRLRAAGDARDEATLNEIIADGFVAHVAGMGDADKATWMRNVSMFYTAFSGLTGPINDLVAEGDRVALRLTFSGTHTADIFGVPASHKSVKFEGFFIFRLADGKIVEEWGCMDVAGLMQQIAGTSAD